jgi:hypothetical protein
MFKQTNVENKMPPAARGALFVKTAPLDPPQKLFIRGGSCAGYVAKK